jgi:hypothetical protein
LGDKIVRDADVGEEVPLARHKKATGNSRTNLKGNTVALEFVDNIYDDVLWNAPRKHRSSH